MGAFDEANCELQKHRILSLDVWDPQVCRQCAGAARWASECCGRPALHGCVDGNCGGHHLDIWPQPDQPLAKTCGMAEAAPDGFGEVPVYRPTIEEFRGFSRFVRWLQHQPEYRRTGLAKVRLSAPKASACRPTGEGSPKGALYCFPSPSRPLCRVQSARGGGAGAEGFCSTSRPGRWSSGSLADQPARRRTVRPCCS